MLGSGRGSPSPKVTPQETAARGPEPSPLAAGGGLYLGPSQTGAGPGSQGKVPLSPSSAGPCLAFSCHPLHLSPCISHSYHLALFGCPVFVSPLGPWFSSPCDSRPLSPRRRSSEPCPGLTKARGPILGPPHPGKGWWPRSVPHTASSLPSVPLSLATSTCLGLPRSGRAVATCCAPCYCPWPCCWLWLSPAPCSS